MITRDPAAEIDRETGETDTLIETDPQTDGDVEVETAITVTGEMIPTMIGHEGAARTLLTLGTVVEVVKIGIRHLADQRLSNRARSVLYPTFLIDMRLTHV